MEKDVISNEYNIAVTEILDILKYLPKSIISKVPAKFMKILKDNAIQGYEPKFDYSQGLDKVPLSNKTRALLAMIYRNYICSQEERIEYDKILYKNEEIYQRELRGKYNPDNILKKQENIEKEENKNTQLVEYKEQKWHKKLFHKIIYLFK